MRSLTSSIGASADIAMRPKVCHSAAREKPSFPALVLGPRHHRHVRGSIVDAGGVYICIRYGLRTPRRVYRADVERHGLRQARQSLPELSAEVLPGNGQLPGEMFPAFIACGC